MIPSSLLETVQSGSFRFSWRGIQMVKNPFDFALYSMLLSDLRPRTVIELGSHLGGSALWLADQVNAMELDAEVHSFDLRKATLRDFDLVNLHFHQGDASNLEGSVFEGWVHPWLVIDDASHCAPDVLAALEFFHCLLQPGDFVVVEDGIADTQLGMQSALLGGPSKALREFLGAHPSEYEIDRHYCDFWGPNVTWNPDGYLRRL